MFESLSTVSGWDDASKASYFPLYLHGTAHNWNIAYTNSRELAGLTGPPTWKDLKDSFYKAFKVKLSEELEKTILLRKKEEKEKISDYYYEVLRLCMRKRSSSS